MPSLIRHVSLVIQRESAGPALLEFLCSRFTYHDRDEWLRRLADGQLRVNGAVVDPATVLAIGDRIDYDFVAGPEPEVNLEYGILYEDADLFIVNKPANLPCHPAGCFFNHTLWALLKERFDGNYFALANRLDRETSGVLAVAKTQAATRHLQRQFARHRVDKRYLAVVEGVFPDRLDAAGWLSPDTTCEVRKKRRFVLEPKDETGETPGIPVPPPGLSRWSAGVSPAPAGLSLANHPSAGASPAGGEWAETSFRRVAASATELSLVEALPKTGRLHQLRATLCSLGFPLVGDKIYGVDPAIFIRYCDGVMTPDDHRRLRLDRQALHASVLRLHHPTDNRELEFTAPLPEEMRALLA